MACSFVFFPHAKLGGQSSTVCKLFLDSYVQNRFILITDSLDTNSDSKVSGTIARPVCAINFSRDQSSDKLINFLDSQLDTQDSRLDTRVSSLEARGWRLKGLSTYF